MRFWYSFYLVTLIFFIDIVKSGEQEEVTSEEDVEYRCTGFGFNWAAEIRCLRQLLQSCEENHTPSQRLRGENYNFVIITEIMISEQNNKNDLRKVDKFDKYSESE